MITYDNVIVDVVSRGRLFSLPSNKRVWSDKVGRVKWSWLEEGSNNACLAVGPAADSTELASLEKEGDLEEVCTST